MTSASQRARLRATQIVRHPGAWIALSFLSTTFGLIISLNGWSDPPKFMHWIVSSAWQAFGTVAFFVTSIALALVTLLQGPLRDRLVLQTKRRMASDLTPVANGVHSLARGSSKNDATLLKERTLYALKELLALNDPRLCLYFREKTEEKSRDQNQDSPDSLVETLEWDDDCMVGRSATPRKRTYVRGSNPVADRNFQVVDTLQSRLLTDWKDAMKNGDPKELDCVGGGYGGFLVVPVVAGNQVEGVLTVDVPDKALLSTEHVVLAELAGRLLGAALYRIKRRSGRNNPQNPLE